ncbi:MAG: glutamate synthase subunit alpha, partial [Parvibaculum sp.]|nr:glutamate synthase subunit alpha [Parvibaculum sp.]
MTQKREDMSRDPATHLAGLPAAQGLYDPRNEHDACGIGFVANIHNRKSHKMIEDGLRILENLEHRGAVGADPKAGDGAGILIQIPDAFFRKEAKKLGFELPAEGHYGIGHLFLPMDSAERAKICALAEKVIAEEGQLFLGWRDVPVDNSDLGYSVKPTEPFHRQVFVGRGASCKDQDAFERKLFVIRKRIFNTLFHEGGTIPKGLYIASLSSRTVVYKGMLMAAQVGTYYKDLTDPEMVTALALVHQRFSTNT